MQTQTETATHVDSAYWSWKLQEVEVLEIDIEVPRAASPSPLAVEAPDDQQSSLAYRQMFRVLDDMQAMIRQRDAALDALATTQQEILWRLAAAAELRDSDTGVHIVRIGVLSAMLAHWAGLDQVFCERLFKAAPMHDIGKIGIPDAVLKKAGQLDEGEWQIMRRHPEIGARILADSRVPELQLAAEIALCHHEKYDGSGYPNGLSKGQIPFTARIVSLVDYYDALSMDRCYRPALPTPTVLQMIKEGSGKHFDPALVELLLQHQVALESARHAINQNVSVAGYANIEAGYWQKFV